MEDKKLYTIPQAAVMCSVGRSTMWRWVKSGRLRSAMTAGGHHRIHDDDLQRFREQNKMGLRLRDQQDKKRILVVDDDVTIRILFGRVFAGTQYDVDYAVDGFDAGKKITKFDPDLMVLDLIMPNLDGFEVCRRIKADPETADIKIIAMSGFVTEENRQRILDCGADLFLPKPLDTARIKKEINNFLG